MLSVERRRLLLQHVRAQGSGNVIELAQTLGVSVSTVRRDLNEMDDRGLITRVHGGASVIDSDTEPGVTARMQAHPVEKQHIGRAAAELVPDNSTILITGGTTTNAMVGHLTGKSGLTVLTNSLEMVFSLGRMPEISVVVLGGVLRHDEMSLLGPITDLALAEFHVDISFCSAFGIDPDVGLSAADVSEAGTDRRMLARAGKLVVLADSSKFGRRGPVRVADVEQIDCLVTDSGAPIDALETMRRRGVHVITADDHACGRSGTAVEQKRNG